MFLKQHQKPAPMRNFNRFFLFLTCALLLGTSAVKAQKKPKIKGNRIVAPYKAAIEPFHTVLLSEDLTIHIVAADTSGVAMLADDNLPAVFKFQVTDSVLTISTYYTITASKQLDITLFTPSLDSIQLANGEIGLTLDPRFKKLKAVVSGGATLAATGTIASFSMDLNDKAFVTLNGSVALLNLQMKDRATATLYTEVSEQASLSLQDKAGVQWEGTTPHLSASVQGGSELSAGALEIKEAMVNAWGSARVDLFVVDHLTYFAKEDSYLNLYGLPKIDLLAFSGTSQLRKRELK